jgi:uncharacterized protein
LLTFFPSLFALEIPARPDGYVTDRADLLSIETRKKIEQILHDYERQTTNQVVVATFSSLEGESLEDFSIRLAEVWKIGQKGRDNGVILLIFKEERKMRIEVGYGLEGVFPDALAGQVIQTVIGPYFKRGDFDGGVSAGIQAIVQATRGEFQSEFEPRETPFSKDLEILFKILLFFMMILFAVDLLRYGIYHRGHRIYADRYSFWEWWFLFSLFLLILRLIFKAVFETRLSSRGGYYGHRTGFGGFSSGRGFSGGGGRFGGGGASGSW